MDTGTDVGCILLYNSSVVVGRVTLVHELVITPTLGMGVSITNVTLMDTDPCCLAVEEIRMLTSNTVSSSCVTGLLTSMGVSNSAVILLAYKEVINFKEVDIIIIFIIRFFKSKISIKSI